MMKLKKEKVLILKRKSWRDDEDFKEYIQARTFIYKGHKFNLQGNHDNGYIISDNDTGVLLSGYYFKKMKDIESERVISALEYFLNEIKDSEEYFKLKERFEKANIKEAE